MDAKKTYKDSLFRTIFKDKRRLAHLYRALSGENVSKKDIRLNTLRGVFMNDVKNDISFRIGNRLIILIEHQSTWNPNMPLRFFWYLSKLYRNFVDLDMIYRSTLVKIPTPEFYVLYNGTADIPDFQELKLSDSFAQSGSALELTVKCYNINYDEGKDLLNSCQELLAYSTFVHQVRLEQKKGKSLFTAVKAAIRYCESHDLMAHFFKRNEREVYDMVNFKWDDARAKEIAVEESRAEGLAEGLKEGRAEGRVEGHQEGLSEGMMIGKTSAILEMAIKLLKKSHSIRDIADVTDLSAEEIKKIAKEHGLAY